MQSVFLKPVIRNLDQPVYTICRKFTGPYERSPEYISTVQADLKAEGINFKEMYMLGIYFDDPAKKDPQLLECYQGVFVDVPFDVPAPYFNYDLAGKYLYCKAEGNPQETIPAIYREMFQYIMQNQVQLESAAGNQVMSFINGKLLTEVYIKITE
jgi:effector-binding domain-containing protein